jgi:hypothetical protein
MRVVIGIFTSSYEDEMTMMTFLKKMTASFRRQRTVPFLHCLYSNKRAEGGNPLARCDLTFYLVCSGFLMKNPGDTSSIVSDESAAYP